MMRRMLTLVRGGGHPPAAGDLRLLEGGRPGQRPDRVRAGRPDRGLPLHPAAPAEGGWRVHRRLLPRRRRRRARRDRPAGGHRRPEGSDTARLWFEDNRYQDYLYLHGLSVEMAEAMAEYIHKRIRAELGFAGEDDRDMDKMLAQGYRGCRYSFGYPACPKLEDQVPLLTLLEAERIGVSLSRRVAAAPGAVDQRDRGAEPAGEILLRLSPPLLQAAGGDDVDWVKRVAGGSIAVGIVVLALKTAAWWLTGSSALYSDALESVVNVAASAIALRRPELCGAAGRQEPPLRARQGRVLRGRDRGRPDHRRGAFHRPARLDALEPARAARNALDRAPAEPACRR